jgi:hypothetical protein
MTNRKRYGKSKKENDKSHSGMPWWGILLIVVGSLAIIAGGGIAVFYYYCSYNNDPVNMPCGTEWWKKTFLGALRPRTLTNYLFKNDDVVRNSTEINQELLLMNN